MTPYARSALAGAATGCRTFTGLAALALTTPRGTAGQPDHLLGVAWMKGLITLAALGELAADKLPNAPSRLAPLGLGGRVVVAAGAGVIVSRRHRAASAAGPGDLAGPPSRTPSDSAGHAVVATAACVGAAVLGVRWRRWAARTLGSDHLAAAIEDVAAISLATVAVR